MYILGITAVDSRRNFQPIHLRKSYCHTQKVCSLVWSSNGRYLASGGDDSLVNVWEPSSIATYNTVSFNLDFPVSTSTFADVCLHCSNWLGKTVDQSSGACLLISGALLGSEFGIITMLRFTAITIVPSISIAATVTDVQIRWSSLIGQSDRLQSTQSEFAGNWWRYNRRMCQVLESMEWHTL